MSAATQSTALLPDPVRDTPTVQPLEKDSGDTSGNQLASHRPLTGQGSVPRRERPWRCWAIRGLMILAVVAVFQAQQVQEASVSTEEGVSAEANPESVIAFP
ncbi:MAG: hypothetical protein ACRBK7_12840 [Acidimicrobiales bacterium]